ncbi:MAG: hypothetical protein QG565_1346 [Campylobacterota bacterium]|nr:hypothetical protein [Campylobacterota bacterium]MDQ1268670.1 hypothetical protein [Campylobacterota bacterium]MDQ1338603.1 hypothetical protein [Campylobacterota bacterium]
MKRNIYIDFAYLITLAATLGAVVVLGAIAAPVIFHTQDILNSAALDSYNAGIVMAEIFRRFSYWIYFLAFFIAAYEMVMYKNGQRDAIIFASSVTALFSALMFSAVYSPKIISMQGLGAEATQSDTFRNTHFASELDFKILATALLILFIRRLMLLKLR